MLTTTTMRRATVTMMIRAVATYTILFVVLAIDGAPLNAPSTGDIVSGSEFLSVLMMGSDPNDRHLVHDISKKEAPRLDNLDVYGASPGEGVKRSPRSNKDDLKGNALKSDYDEDLQPASSSYYGENQNGDRFKNGLTPLDFDDPNSPKIIGVRVTSSVAVARGKHTAKIAENPPPMMPQLKTEESKRFLNDSPTTWRPPLFRFINGDFYKGASSNKQYVSTLPETLPIGANIDYIQQQKERELNKKKNDIVHPYQRAISYHTRDAHNRPHSYSYSSIVNTFNDASSKLTALNDWTSTKSESAVTEPSAGYVTLINHHSQQPPENVDKVTEVPPPQHHHVPPLPIVYSEPAKVYSEPAKVYSKPEKIYSEPAKVYSEPAKNYGEPSKVYGEPSKVYSEPAKVYGEPSKVYSEPAKVYGQPSQVYHTLPEPTFEEHKPIFKYEPQQNTSRSNGEKEQNYEVDESVSVMTNGRIHGVQEGGAKAAEGSSDDAQKVGYVVEGRNYRRYRVEERTSDGFIVGEYGVVSHDDGTLRGVRYTADGAANPRLIYDALMKFLSL